MQNVNSTFKRYLEGAEQLADFKEQVTNNSLALAVIYRYVLDALYIGYKDMLKKPMTDTNAALLLAESRGEQKVLFRLAGLFTEFGLDDHPLIKSARFNTLMGGIHMETKND